MADGQIGILSQDFKGLITKNSRELSAVRGNILSAAEGREVKTIFITSAGSFEGKTVSAISIAYGLSSEAESKVLLVDLDPKLPKIAKLFNLKGAPGLTDLLTSNAQYSDVLRNTERDNLSIIPQGTKISNTLSIFKPKIFKEKFDSLKDAFDYLIFDGPPVLGSSNASLVAQYFDGIILVVECEKTRWEILQQTQEKISKVGGKILGVVLNKRKYYIPRALYGKV